jgi:putative ABC transport system permease protein
MRVGDLLSISAGNLLRTRNRTLLSILGIVIGIMSVILVLSIGDAARDYLISQISSFGSDLIFVASGPPPENNGGAVPSPFAKQVLTTSDYKRITRQPWVTISSALTLNQDTVVAEGQTADVQVEGTTPNEVPLFDLHVASGNWFSWEDVDSRNRVAVIGKSVADKLFGADDPINKSVKIQKQNFRIIGVMPKSGMRFTQDLDHQIYVPYTSSMDAYGIKNVFRFIVKTNLPIRQGVANMQQLMRDSHHLSSPKDDDFRVLTQDDAIQIVSQITQILQIFLTSVAAISLLVGGIGIMNIMYVTVTERTREIGLRKALGARRGDVLGQFVAEAAMLSLLGGIIGVALGIGLTWLAIQAILQFQSGWSFHLSVSGILLGVGVSTAIGLVFGYFPARRAAVLHPIEALRHE